MHEIDFDFEMSFLEHAVSFCMIYLATSISDLSQNTIAARRSLLEALQHFYAPKMAKSILLRNKFTTNE